MAEEIRRVGYVADHASFGRFLLSEQARDPVIKAAADVANLARITEDRSKPGEKGSGDGTRLSQLYRVNRTSPPVMVAGNLRVGAEVFNNSIYAARHEFGDAIRRGRKQGGNHGDGGRTLRRAGGRIGELRGDPA